jgi:protein phosphatase
VKSLKNYIKSDIGKVRKINQDSAFGETLTEKIAYTAVCDGMGGVNGGEIASGTAIKCISEYLKTNFAKKETKKMLLDCFEFANTAVYNESLNDQNLNGMGTTAVLAFLKNNVLHIVNVGDSRAYKLNSNEIVQLTADHSVVQEMIDNGELTKEEARFHPQKNIITRVLGINGTIQADYFKPELNKKDVILLCSDGLSNLVEDSEIYKIFLECSSENNFESFCEKLIEKANSNGGNDNITVAVLARD